MEIKSFYKIKFSDCDSFKHLHNTNYIDFMLNAREDHLKEFHNMEMTDLYQKGLSWMVGGHEIVYLRPAFYTEIVCIHSALIKASNDILKVEMIMMDQKETQIKALLWTDFIHINTQLGRREKHPEWFLNLIKPIVDPDLADVNSLKDRLTLLKTAKLNRREKISESN